MSATRKTIEFGPKPVVEGMDAACSTGNSIVTETVMNILRNGGTAVDAGIAASLVQAVVEPHLSNHGGSVSFLFWEASTKSYQQLNAIGALVPEKAPFKPVPQGIGGYCPPGWPAAAACIPGYMPGLKAIHERFGTMSWATLCEDAIRWAEDGHIVSSLEYGVNIECMPFLTYFPEGKAFFAPDGFPVAVGKTFRNDAMARTMRLLADEGPDHFISGGWAAAFVETANRLGWEITLDDMKLAEPRWTDPITYEHRGHQIIQLAPPERQAYFCALVLGILDQLGIAEGGWSETERLYYMAHVLRWADREVGYLHDPHIFDVPGEVWLDPDYHAYIARIIGGSLPKIDLSDHVLATAGRAAVAASTSPPGAGLRTRQPLGSCELAIVDADGNWVQMMHTLQTGGIPGAVVEGIPMVGTHAIMSGMDYPIAGWIAPGTRPRCVIGNTIVAKDGAPVLSLGTPGNAHCTVPQVLSNILDLGMAPYDAADAPRMLPLDDRFKLVMEARIDKTAVEGLIAKGITVSSLLPYDWRMGSFQMCWRDPVTGKLAACADPRRLGDPDGYRTGD